MSEPCHNCGRTDVEVAYGEDGDLCETCARPLTRREIEWRRAEQRWPEVMLFILCVRSILEALCHGP